MPEPVTATSYRPLYSSSSSRPPSSSSSCAAASTAATATMAYSTNLQGARMESKPNKAEKTAGTRLEKFYFWVSRGLWFREFGVMGVGGLHGSMVDIIMLRLQCVSCVQQLEMIMAVIQMQGPHCTGKKSKIHVREIIWNLESLSKHRETQRALCTYVLYFTIPQIKDIAKFAMKFSNFF